VDEKNDQIAHHRIVAGRGILRNLGRNNNSPATGGWSAFFAHRALQALAWVTVVLVALSIPSGGGMSTGEKEDRSNRWVLGAFTLIGLLMAYFSAYTDRVGFWVVDGNAMRWTGVVLCALGGVLRIVPVYVLGNRFSGLVAIQAGASLGDARYLQRNPEP
jgi:hypothetical protein